MELVPFIILSAMLLLAFVMIISVKLAGVQNRGEQEKLDAVTLKIQEEITIAASVNNGYTRNFTLPTKIGLKTYNVGILKNTTIYASTDLLESSLVTFNVSGQPRPGNNLLRKTDDIITLN